MWARRSGLTYPALPWVVILVVSMIYRVFVLRTKNPSSMPYAEAEKVIQILITFRSPEVEGHTMVLQRKPVT